jgi:hypothetical protein
VAGRDACAKTRTDVDIFSKRLVQIAELSTRVTLYKPIAPVDQFYLEFVIPGDLKTYVEFDI